MIADVRMLHNPNSVDLSTIKSLVAKHMSLYIGTPIFRGGADTKCISKMIYDTLAPRVNGLNVTAGLYVGYRMVTGKSPAVVLRWRSYDSQYFWDTPKKFSSRRKARVWAKGHIRACVPASIEFRPVEVISSIAVLPKDSND